MPIHILKNAIIPVGHGLAGWPDFVGLLHDDPIWSKLPNDAQSDRRAALWFWAGKSIGVSRDA